MNEMLIYGAHLCFKFQTSSLLASDFFGLVTFFKVSDFFRVSDVFSDFFQNTLS